MSSVQEFTEWCRDGLFKFQQLFARDTGRPGDPNTEGTPSDKNLEPNAKVCPKQRNRDDKSKLHFRLPFNARNSRVEDDGKSNHRHRKGKQKNDTGTLTRLQTRLENIVSSDNELDKVSKGQKTSRSNIVDPLPIRESSSRPPIHYRHYSPINITPCSKYDEITAPQSTPSSPRTLDQSLVGFNDTDAERLKELVGLSPKLSPFRYSRTKTDDKLVVFLGKLQFEVSFSFDRKCLAVNLIKGENVGGQNKIHNTMNFYVMVYLMPGTLQIQSSRIVKNTKHPCFNQEFLFTTELDMHELRRISLQIKVYNNLPTVNDEYIGGIGLPLIKYDLTKVTKLCRNIEPSVSLQRDIGHMFVSLNLNIARKKLVVTVGRVTRLNYHPISGVPNPYVSVEVSQDLSFIIKKRSKSLKKTTFPTFSYTVTFDLVNATPETIDLTHVIVTVRSEEHDKLDSVLGEVRLGYDSSEDAEIEHWDEVKRCPGQDIGKWHYLMESEEPFV